MMRRVNNNKKTVPKHKIELTFSINRVTLPLIFKVYIKWDGSEKHDHLIQKFSSECGVRLCKHESRQESSVAEGLSVPQLLRKKKWCRIYVRKQLSGRLFRRPYLALCRCYLLAFQRIATAVDVAALNTRKTSAPMSTGALPSLPPKKKNGHRCLQKVEKMWTRWKSKVFA